MRDTEKILVTGGGGFVGTNVIRKLKQTNACVTATYHSGTLRFPVGG